PSAAIHTKKVCVVSQQTFFSCKKQVLTMHLFIYLSIITYITYHYNKSITVFPFIDSCCYPLLAPRPPRLDSVCFFKEAKRSSESLRKRLIFASKFSCCSRVSRLGRSFAFLIDNPILPSFSTLMTFTSTSSPTFKWSLISLT